MPGSVIVPAPARHRQALAARWRRSRPWTSAASPSRRRSSAPASAPTQVDYVFMGQVLQAGQGQITARQAAVKAGIPMTVPAITVNKVCLSGLNAIYLADQMIAGRRRRHRGGRRHGVDDERALPAARRPRRLPHRQQRAGRRHDRRRPVVRLRRRATWAPAPSSTPERRRHHPRGPGRARRQEPRAGGGRHQGGPLRRRDRRRCRARSARATRSWSSTDEGVRPGTTTESLGGLRPAFDEGRHDHRRQRVADLRRRRAPIVVMSRAKAERPRRHAPRRARRATARSPDPTTSLLHAAVTAIKRALEPADKSVTDIDLFELNEAFAAVGLASMRRPRHQRRRRQRQRRRHRPRPPDRHVGHPARRSRSLNELRRRGGGLGAAALCGGGGQGDATLVRAL